MTWDSIWDQVFSTSTWGEYPAEDLIRFVARNFYKKTPRSSIRFLELGCGPGSNLWYLAREGFSAYGIDGSSVAVNKARNRLDRDCPQWNGEVVVGDFTSLSYADAFFHACIDNEAVCTNSFDDALAVYKQAARTLVPNGKLFVRTFATGCWGEGTGKQAGKNAWYPTEGPLANLGYARFTSRDDIDVLLQDFTIESAELLTRTVNNTSNAIIEWIIIASRKAA